MPLLLIYPKESKSAYNGDTYIPVFRVQLFIIAKSWLLIMDEWIEKCGAYTQWNIIQL
jgi:hypothetical protein